VSDRSQAIINRNGILVDDILHLTDGGTIVGVKPDERIRYLGCSFNSELVFDNSCIEVLNMNLEKLSTSSLLKSDQKLNIINQYIFPMLVYPLQAAPLSNIPSYITSGLDVMIRRCSRETETIAHVTVSCPSNNLLITNSHHKVKHRLTQLLQDKSFQCFEEVHGIDSDGQSRFSDIIAFDTKKKKAFIIDPTIRYETNDTGQDSKIVEEKSSIYEKCIPFYKEKYANSFEIQDWFVRGLWFGRRGTFAESVLIFF